MTKLNAITKARLLAKENKDVRLVVYDPTAAPDTCPKESCYFTCEPRELDGYFKTAEVIWSSED